MNDGRSVTIAACLAHLPVVGGLAVPWITPCTADGRHLFGTIDGGRAAHALRHRWCGVCGRPLGRRLVLLLRLSDLARQCTNEPALHPQCAAYTCAACPMIAGRLAHYRSAPAPLDPTMLPPSDTESRLGARAEPWFAVWLTDYDVITDHANLAASYRGTRPLRIRPITWQLPKSP